MEMREAYYTKEQVMDKLDVAASTVYHLAKTKRIEMEHLPKGVSRTKRYVKESVDQYYALKNTIPNGLSIREFGRLHKTTTQKIYQLINKLELPIEKVTIGKRQRIILSPEQQRVLKKELEQKVHKGTKSDFYCSKEDIALYQLFFDESKRPYRIMRNERQEWGFLRAFTNQFVSYNEAVTELQLKRAYTLHEPSITSNQYVNFSFNVNNVLTYVFLDCCYTHLGIENMHLLQREHTVEISIKAVNMPAINHAKMLDYLNESCLNSVIEVIAGEYLFHIQDKAVTVMLKGDVYHALKKVATEQRISLADCINQLVEQELINK